mmetsp:Transcript_22292/g.53315  ORF Transcript_22292/g.53315 Transcript_22292/m.53315 type:complete len:418 (+) Transcript_22292:325-1578(+)
MAVGQYRLRSWPSSPLPVAELSSSHEGHERRHSAKQERDQVRATEPQHIVERSLRREDRDEHGRPKRKRPRGEPLHLRFLPPRAWGPGPNISCAPAQCFFPKLVKRHQDSDDGGKDCEPRKRSDDCADNRAASSLDQQVRRVHSTRRGRDQRARHGRPRSYHDEGNDRTDDYRAANAFGVPVQIGTHNGDEVAKVESLQHRGGRPWEGRPVCARELRPVGAGGADHEQHGKGQDERCGERAVGAVHPRARVCVDDPSAGGRHGDSPCGVRDPGDDIAEDGAALDDLRHKRRRREEQVGSCHDRADRPPERDARQDQHTRGAPLEPPSHSNVDLSEQQRLHHKEEPHTAHGREGRAKARWDCSVRDTEHPTAHRRACDEKCSACDRALSSPFCVAQVTVTVWVRLAGEGLPQPLLPCH